MQMLITTALPLSLVQITENFMLLEISKGHMPTYYVQHTWDYISVPHCQGLKFYPQKHSVHTVTKVARTAI